MDVHYPEGGRFVRDPSQMTTAEKCPLERWLTLDDALKRFPRAAFDYVWLIDPPAYDPMAVEGLRPIWRNGASVLYKVERGDRIATSDTPTGSGTRPTR